MDTWYKYKNKKFKIDLSAVKISEKICYGNMLVHEIAWAIVCGKKPSKLFSRFFANASVVLQATIIQNGFADAGAEVYAYVDSTTNELLNDSNSAEDYALILGNLSEFDDMKYTFVELIGFVRAMAAKI